MTLVDRPKPPRRYTLEELREMREQQLRDWELSFPKAGDLMFVASASGAHVDPLKFADPTGLNERQLMGRWSLYAIGFREAADRLVNGLQADEMASTPGAALVYPILFCYRHYLELDLKGLISSVLWWSYAFSDIDQDTLQKGEKRASKEHRLKTLWETLKKLHPGCDAWAADQDRNAFEALLFEVDRHDPSSQAARYPIDIRGNQTLAALTVVDVGIVKAGVHKIARYLEMTQHHLADQIKARSNVDSCGEDSA
jgi:hypothetical protein